MFDKIKRMKQLWDAKRAIESEKIEAEYDGVRVVVNGSMKVQEIKLNPNLDLERQQASVKECLNQAMQKAQAVVAKMMQGMMN